MLFLLCQVGAGRFVIPGERIIEVLPMVSVSRMAGLPDAVAGVMQYRGVSIPVVDLSQLTAGFPAPARMNTRVVLVTARNVEGQSQVFGLIAERATRMISLTQEQFTVLSEEGGDLAFLGKVAWEFGIAMRQIEVDRISERVLAPAASRRTNFAHLRQAKAVKSH